MRLKKAISLILSICVLFSLFIPVEAAAATTAEKVDALKTLTVFSSTTMDAQVKRLEAAVYAVRILGKEQYIKDNASTYKNTKYSDVDSSQWYAPYVGYCDELGIIKDAQSGKFLPDRYITEKAFLNIILGAMGYRYQRDYTISNIFAKAYEFGLYTDVSYKTKTADNTNFRKADVVNILYNALGSPNKGTKIKMVQNLVAEKVITKETAISTGLLADNVITAVLQVTAMDQGNVLVKFNEPVQNLTADNIKIYKTGSPDKTLSFTIKAQGNDGSVILGTGTQEAFEAYTIDLVNVKDIEGNAASGLTGRFEGVQGSEVKSDFFRINKVVPVSKDCLNVYFTQPVNMNSLVASAYEIWNGENIFLKGSSQVLAVQPLSGTDNAVSVYLKSTSLTKDALYTLKINGSLTGAYGVKLGDGNGDSARFKGVDTVNSTNTNVSVKELSLTNISVIDNQTMKLEFNMEITPTLSKQILNYYIADAVNNQLTVKKAVLTSEAGKNNRIVLVSINGTFNQGAACSLSIDYLTDVSR
ncbi:MAG: S-layer homology domain-containing protein [Clostridia bacterium]|nr:S-layer homology domain-containing protein [Clostridia bacterium]